MSLVDVALAWRCWTLNHNDLNTIENIVTKQRDCNRGIDDSPYSEREKYAYSFDYDVMHPFMVRSFEPFFNTGSLLELGSYAGEFTKRFLDHFKDITCVEASDVAIFESKAKTTRLGSNH